jgi:2-polyprenyl-3-methyl-5-hydroxy-6-metoxy-1,4-benzoquinol methylase
VARFAPPGDGVADNCAAMTSTYSFDNSWNQAQARLAALEARFDPGTVSHLEALGVASGWRCLEVGAGGGSVAGWLCGRVGPAGYVLATDLDTRYVERLEMPNLKIQQHDVVHEALPISEFDLVHSRAVLSHLPERDQVLGKMIAALRPGGWLLCEDLDRMTVALVAPEDPKAQDLYIKVEGAIAEAMAARGHAYEYGRQLPARLAGAGLTDVSGEGRVFLRRRGADAATARLTAEQLRADLFAAHAITEGEFDSYLELLENPAFIAQTAMMIAAWGRRPAAN